MNRPLAAVALLICAAAVLTLSLRLLPRRGTRFEGQADAVVGTDTQRDEVARRAELDASVWKEEIVAQRHEQFIVQLWDRIRATPRAAPTELAKIDLLQITVPQLVFASRIDHDIEIFSGKGAETLTLRQWRDYLRNIVEAGYELSQSEWHHLRFETIDGVAQSTVSVTLHVVNAKEDVRLAVSGELRIRWSNGSSIPQPETIDASRLTLQRRRGPATFRLAATLPSVSGGSTDFLAAYDLNGDGLSEILFGTHLFRNRGGGDFVAERLWDGRDEPLQSAVLADFNGDGRSDLLCADPRQHPKVYCSDEHFRFSQPPLTIEVCDKLQGFSTAITAGDVNGDGTVDVWLTQYKPPYVRGQMPTPYFDANDGYPSYLLLNDGNANFKDRTAQCGLASKRFRRTYSSSLVDIDEDEDLDLVVVSDFAGLDIYRNNGRGDFQDVTNQMVAEPHTFGMSHAVADFDGDSKLDLYVCGMGSTTARRLDAMQSGPPDALRETEMRTVMGYGNRMYLYRQGRFVEPDFRDRVARTGWSWGVAELDFDNDGDRDIYVGNGHISGPSARDYCSVFWRHDIYTGTSSPDTKLHSLFLETQQSFQAQGSWNGYEHNRLLMNQAGAGFVEVGFLLGLAQEFDTRNVVADDIDADGRVDLLIVEKPRSGPARLQVWKNHGPSKGNWIAIAIPEKPGAPTVGTTVHVHSEGVEQVAHVLNGDSFNSQHSATLHFGLGDSRSVDRVEVRRPQQAALVLRQPAAGSVHTIRDDR